MYVLRIALHRVDSCTCCVSCGELASAGKSPLRQDNACALTHPTQNGQYWQSRSSLLCQTRKCLLQWLFVQSEDSQTPSPRHEGCSTAGFPHRILAHISSILLFPSNTSHLGCQTITRSIQCTPTYAHTQAIAYMMDGMNYNSL